MTRASHLALCLSLAVVAGGLGCVTPPLPPLGVDRTARQLEADEQALWKESREIQYKIESSGLLFEDAGVDGYLAQLIERLTPSRLRSAGLEPRVEVISDINVHGYSFANGVVYVHTALLAQMTDETMLASMLTRELAHVANRNALRAKRENRRNADTLAWVGVGSALVEGGGNAKLLVQAVSMTSAVGFHHTIETIADERGLEFLDEAGYAVGDAPALYERTLAYIGEVHAQGAWGWVPFVPPPHIVARVDGMRQLIAAKYPNQQPSREPLLSAEAFARTIHPVAIRQTELELAAGLFRSAETTARRAALSQPRDPAPWTLLGRALAGQRAKPIQGQPVPSIRDVRDSYEEALRRDRRDANAVRELAMTYYRTSGTARSKEDAAEALGLFRRYLRLAPEAKDRAYVEGYVQELGGGG